VAHVRYYVKRRSVHANLAASDVAPNISSSVLVGFPHDLRIYDHRPSEPGLTTRKEGIRVVNPGSS
jgi:hypothetical protein